MDRLAELEERYTSIFECKPDGNIMWFIDEIKTLRQAARADQVVILRLRQECLEAINEADAYKRERDELQAKLARANHLAVNLTEQVRR